MAEEIGVAYLSIAPSLRNFKSQLEAAVNQQTTPVGESAGQQVGAGITQGVEKSVSAATPRMRDVFRGLFTAPVATIRGFVQGASSELDAIGGKSVALRNLGTNALAGAGGIKRLAAQSLSLSAVRESASGLVGSLGGVATMMGTGGPLGIAIAGAAIGWNAYTTAQDNARAAAEAFAETLNKNTGAATLETYTKAIADFRANFSDEDFANAGLTFKQIAQAIVQQGPALDEVREKAHEYKLELNDNWNPWINAHQDALSNSIEALVRDYDNGTDTFIANRAAADGATEAYKTQAGAVAVLRKAYLSLPTDIHVQISTNLAEVISLAGAARAALASIGGGAQYSAGAALSDYMAGLQSGRYKDPITAAKEAAKAAREAAKKTSVRTSGGSGGGARVPSAAQTAMKQAREQLRKDVGGDFIRSLLTASPSQIRDAVNDLMKDVKSVFSGKVEKRLVDRVGKDNQKLRALARQRQSVADQLSDATSNLANLRSSKKQFTDTFVSNTMGNISDLTLSAKGVQEFLNRRLTHLRAFKKAITTLAKRGLPQSLLNDLIAAGPEAAWKTAQNLAASDAATFSGIKTTALQLQGESTSFGKTAAGMMYDSGIATAKGLISGFRSQDSQLEKAMRHTALLMRNSIRKALGIKSPSTVFAEVGRQIPRGVIQGIRRETPDLSTEIARMVRIPSISAAPFHGGVRGGDSADIVAAVRALADRPQAVYIDGVLVGTTRAMSEVARSLAVS